MIKIDNCVVVSRGDDIIGTFKYMDKYDDGDDALYFLDCFSKEWEAYDYSFNILTKKELKQLIIKSVTVVHEDNLWKCDGCDVMFDKSKIVDSIHEPYYACQDCEDNLLKNRRERECSNDR